MVKFRLHWRYKLVLLLTAKLQQFFESLGRFWPTTYGEGVTRDTILQKSNQKQTETERKEIRKSERQLFHGEQQKVLSAKLATSFIKSH